MAPRPISQSVYKLLAEISINSLTQHSISMVESCYRFSHVTTKMLPWHMQKNCLNIIHVRVIGIFTRFGLWPYKPFVTRIQVLYWTRQHLYMGGPIALLFMATLAPWLSRSTITLDRYPDLLPNRLPSSLWAARGVCYGYRYVQDTKITQYIYKLYGNAPFGTI